MFYGEVLHPSKILITRQDMNFLARYKLRSKIIITQQEIYLLLRNILYSKKYICYQEIYCTARNILYSKKYICYQEIYLLSRNIFVIKKYIVQQEIYLLASYELCIEYFRGIGAWFEILQLITFFAVVSNAFIIAFTSSFIPKVNTTEYSDGTKKIEFY